MFLLISGSQNGALKQCTTTVHQYGVSIQSSTKVSEISSANNSETEGHKDLRVGQIVYLLVFYNISLCWFLPLDGFQFSFLLWDSENNLLLKTESLDNAILELWLA